MMKQSKLLLGYDFEQWYTYGEKEPITTDISPNTNSHILICGMSGSGKSYLTNQIFARLCVSGGKIYFADYKQEDSFQHLRGCPRYYPYNKTLEALEEVYTILQNRQSGEDKSREPITLIWDEYVSNVLALLSINKKKAETVMRQVSELLMLGRSLSVRLVCACQRPDSVVFPVGSKVNYGVTVIIGAAIKSIYEMLLPKEYIENIGNRQFKVGEGVVLLQGTKMQFIKVPIVRDEQRLKQICIEALSK